MSKKWQCIVLALAIVWSAGPIFAADLGKGNILFEWFDGTLGNNLDQFVDGRYPQYPDNPSSWAWRTSFDGPEARGDYYGTHVRGYLYPPADGDYTFWVASDDYSRVWLSTDEDPANKVLICEVPGYTGATQWDKYPEQKSGLIPLKKGKRYYIEALHSEGAGGDRLRVAWGGPTLGTDPVIIAGSYLAPWIRPADLVASSPDPADGKEGVALPLLTWSKGLTAIFHDLYFGTDPEPPLATRLPAGSPSGMYYHAPGITPGTTYYWRVDEVDADGTTVYKGPVWSFTAVTMSAWGPMPPSGERGVLTDTTLQWEPGIGGIEHEIYFGDNEADVAAGAASTFKGKQLLTTLDVTALQGGTKYYWRVDEIDAAGVKSPGEVWNFLTVPTEVSDPNLVGWWKLDEVTGVASDYSGHGNHGQVRGGAKPVAGYAGGALDFDGTNDFVFTGKTAADLGIEGAHAKTVTAWVYTRAFNNGGIFDVGARTAAQDFCLRTRGGGNQWRVQLWGSGNDYDFTYTSRYTWVHFAQVYDGTQMTIYANGAVVTTQPRTLNTAPTNPFQIGAYGWQVNYFNGLIDDVRLYDKALTAEEVGQVFMRADMSQAWQPSPTVGKVTDALQAVPLTWSPGDKAIQHDVYLSADPNIVRDADATDATGAYRGRIDVNSYTPDAVLDWNDTYYWRVDEILVNGDIVKGRVWNFRVTDWLILDDFESYTNESPNRLFQTWLDSYGYSADEFVSAYNGNGTGSGVGHDIWKVESTYYDGSIAERGLRHGGAQSMPLYYTNSGSPYYSETERVWTSPQDWTIEDANGMVLHVRGIPPEFVKTSESSFSLSAAGTDIWGTADQFRYAFKTLTGDGTIIARVVDNGSGTNRWAKGGVMVRAGNDPGAVNAFTAVTGGDGNGGTFQWRPTAAASSLSSRTLTGIAPPYWVRLDRQGDTFTGYMSADGQNWLQEGTSSIDIAMTDPVMIGIAVTSHAANQVREFEFDNITITGKITGAWTLEEIGIAQLSNETALPLYVVIQDSSNRSAVVVHPDANILLSEPWSEWRIPFTDLPGVNMKAVKKMFIGVGDRKNPQAGDDGLVYIDDIGLTR